MQATIDGGVDRLGRTIGEMGSTVGLDFRKKEAHGHAPPAQQRVYARAFFELLRSLVYRAAEAMINAPT